MKLSLCTTGFKDWDIGKIIQWAEPWNSSIQGLELWIGHVEKFHETYGPLDKLTNLLHTSGYKVPVISGYTMFSKTAKEIESDLIQMKRLLDAARQLNCPMVRTFAGHVSSKAASPEMWAETVDGLKRAADLAERYEVDIAIEMHYDTYADNADSIRALFEDIGSPRTVLIFDGANLNADGLDPAHVLRTIYPYIRHVHLKNYRWNHEVRYQSVPVPIFDGDVDNCLLLKELKDRSYEGFVSLEYFGTKGRPSLLDSLREWNHG